MPEKRFCDGRSDLDAMPTAIALNELQPHVGHFERDNGS
jgi:hypothetical protein